MSKEIPKRQRRSLLSKFGLLALATLTVVLALSSIAAGYATWRLGQIDRLEVASVLTDAPVGPVTARDIINPNTPDGSPDGSAADSDSDSSDNSGDVNGDNSSDVRLGSQSPLNTNRFVSLTAQTDAGENYLLVGTDSIAGFDPNDPVAQLRSSNSHLADTIIVARLREDGTAALLSIPRDLLVNIAGTNRDGKINSAYNIDATADLRAARLIDTIENELGITLQHYAEIDLDGFRQLIDAVGGVDIYFEKALRDRKAGDYVDPKPASSEFTIEAGWQMLDGDQALAYVRSRHLYEQNADGTWQRHGVWNDLERNTRQREFLIDAGEQLSSDFLTNPLDLQAALEVAATALTTSDTLNLITDGLRLTGQFEGFDFDTDIEEYELSVKDLIEPGRWSLKLHDEAHNQRVLDVFRGIGWEELVESRVTVLVSGSERSRITSELAQLGFQARNVGESSANAVAGTTTLTYGPQGRLAAALLLSHFQADVELVGDPSLADNTVVLHIANDAETPVISADYRIVDLPPAP